MSNADKNKLDSIDPNTIATKYRFNKNGPNNISLGLMNKNNNDTFYKIFYSSGATSIDVNSDGHFHISSTDTNTWPPNYVTTDTTQTITGEKTFTSALNVKNTFNLNGALEIFAPIPFIDFHYNNTAEDNTSRIIENERGTLLINNSHAFRNNSYQTQYNDNPAIYLDNARYAYGTIPSPEPSGIFGIRGRDCRIIATFEGIIQSNGNAIAAMKCWSYVGNHNASLQLFCLTDGSAQLHFCQATEAYANDNRLATSNWVRDKISAATGKPQNTFSIFNSDNNSLSRQDSNLALRVINQDCSDKIFSGFEYECLDGNVYYFTYDIFDQQNLNDTATLCMLDKESEIEFFCRNMDGEQVKVTFTTEEFLNIYRYSIKQHKNVIIDEHLNRKNILNSCTNMEEIENYLAEWGLLALYTQIKETNSFDPNLIDQDINTTETE